MKIWGESEVRQSYLSKAEYLCKIGDKERAVAAFEQTFEKTVGIGYRIDLVFNLIRIGLFFMDHKIVTANITKAKELMDKVLSKLGLLISILKHKSDEMRSIIGKL